MNTRDADDRLLEEALNGPLLQVPDDFAARVMAVLPERMNRPAPGPPALPAWRVLQAAVVAVCGAAGAVEVFLFACGLWTATGVAVG